MSTRKTAPRKAMERKAQPSKTPTARKAKPARAAKAASSFAAVADAINDQKAREAATPARRARPQPRTRQNKKGLVLYVDPAVTVQLRRLALDTGSSVQELGLEALNALFRRYKLPEFPGGASAPGH